MIHTVLVVDDSLVDRKIICKIIENSLDGVAVIELESGVNMKSFLLENMVHACVLDLKMPEKDGFEIMQEIKSEPLIMDIPIIVCTGVSDFKTIEKVLKMGAFDYFKKPLSEEAMKFALPLKVKNAIDLFLRTQSIVKMSQMDALTGVWNRSAFKKRLFDLESSPSLSSMIMIDVNGLKVANDAYGSDLGDLFLMELSKIIKSFLPIDAFCARWGGDEFVIHLPRTDESEIINFVERVKREFSSFHFEGFQMSLSAGWDIQQKHTQPLSKIMKNAEEAMFRDKIFESISIRSQMISLVLHTLHEKNSREEAHSKRVSEMCYLMGKALGLNEKQMNDMKAVGLLHDIGKIAIDERILNKPGKLQKEEWQEMKRHPEIGYRLIASSPDLKTYASVVLSHHERYDGKGYPNGLVGEEIPELARVLSIIDGFDAMTSERTYKTALSPEEAVLELIRCKGTQFDPRLTDIFIENVLLKGSRSDD